MRITVDIIFKNRYTHIVKYIYDSRYTAKISAADAANKRVYTVSGARELSHIPTQRNMKRRDQLASAGVPNISLTMYPFNIPTDEHATLQHCER